MRKKIRKALASARKLETEKAPVVKPQKYYEQTLNKLKKIRKLLSDGWWVRDETTRKRKSRR